MCPGGVCIGGVQMECSRKGRFGDFVLREMCCLGRHSEGWGCRLESLPSWPSIVQRFITPRKMWGGVTDTQSFQEALCLRDCGNLYATGQGPSLSTGAHPTFLFSIKS